MSWEDYEDEKKDVGDKEDLDAILGKNANSNDWVVIDINQIDKTLSNGS